MDYSPEAYKMENELERTGLFLYCIRPRHEHELRRMYEAYKDDLPLIKALFEYKCRNESKYHDHDKTALVASWLLRELTQDRL